MNLIDTIIPPTPALDRLAAAAARSREGPGKITTMSAALILGDRTTRLDELLRRCSRNDPPPTPRLRRALDELREAVREDAEHLPACRTRTSDECCDCPFDDKEDE